MSLLGAVALLLAVRRGLMNHAARLALSLALLLSFISLLPTPTFVQYFSVTIPFWILFVVCAADRFLHTLPSPRVRRRLLLGSACLVLVFVVSAIPDAIRFLHTGEMVIGLTRPGEAIDWKIATITSVSRAIDAHSRPGEPVMSLWPGYVFASAAEPFDGLQNNSATYLADRLTPEQQAGYHVLSSAKILFDITQQVPRLVVLGNQASMLVDAAPFEKRLKNSGYRVAATIGGATLWQLPQ